MANTILKEFHLVLGAGRGGVNGEFAGDDGVGTVDLAQQLQEEALIAATMTRHGKDGGGSPPPDSFGITNRSKA